LGAAHAHFGRLDVVVNNAGFGVFGALEEVSEDDARRQVETNLLGALWVTQAALPFLREQGSGHLVQVTSEGGVIAYPGIGVYHASKWGVEGFSESLAGEVAHLGIKVTMARTRPVRDRLRRCGDHRRVPARLRRGPGRQRRVLRPAGRARRPAATVAPLLELVDADEPPLRAVFGATPTARIRADYARRLATWEAGEATALRAHGSALPVAAG
jgi:NAD(P)-dependent dehydrogenase (short-subunit alcohol dehydrogenase family)